MAIIIDPGITSSGCIVQNDTMEVYGSAVQTTVNARGSMFVFSGGEATETALNIGGRLEVYSGGAADDTTVNYGGRLEVCGDGTATETTVNSDGQLHVSSGAFASGTAVSSGGYMDINGGAANGITVDRGQLQVYSGGVANGTTVTDVTLGFIGQSINLYVYGNGTANDTTVGSGGYMSVARDGTASGIRVEKNGLLRVYGTAEDICECGGYVIDGTYDCTMTFVSNTFTGTIRGYATVHSNTVASDVRLERGSMCVYNGGVASNTFVASGTKLRLENGVANVATVEKGGTIEILGGTVTQLLECGGYVDIWSQRAEVTFAGGAFSGAITRSATAHADTVATDVRIESGARLEICSGGTASGAIVESGGRMVVFSGGYASAVQLNAGAYFGPLFFAEDRSWEEIVDGSAVVSDNFRIVGNIAVVAEGGVVSGAIISGGQMVVSSGGVACDSIIKGDLTAHSGGVASNTTINSGASMTLSGGVTSNTIISNGGRMTVFSGKMAGRLEIAKGAKVMIYNYSPIDFIVAGETAGAAALVSGWDYITTNGASCTITVAADQAEGTYALASEAATFDKTVTVRTAEAELGTLAVGETLVCGDVAYTLAKTDDLLSLTVTGSAPPTPPTPLTGAEVILTVTDPNHEYFGTMGGWKVQTDQTVAWQDLMTISNGFSYVGLGATAAGKSMPDIYVYHHNYMSVYVTNGIGAITGAASYYFGQTTLSQIGLADFTGDGVSDFLHRTEEGLVRYYADGAFTEVQDLGLEWSVVALGDVDGNGRADIVIAHEAGYVGAYLVGADGSISWADLGNLNANTSIVGAGDVNGDGTDDVIFQVGANYYGAWLCGNGAVTGFFGIGTFDAEVQDIADYNADGTDDLLFRTADGIVGAALITGADATTWAEYGALGSEWSTKGMGIL